MTTQFLLNGNLTLRTFWFQATAKLCRQQLFIYMGSEHSYNKQMYKTNDTDKTEPLDNLPLLIMDLLFYEALYQPTSMGRSIYQWSTWPPAFEAAALSSSHRTTGHNTMKYLGSRPKAHRHFTHNHIIYSHYRRSVCFAWLSPLLSSVFCPLSPFLCLSLSLSSTPCVFAGESILICMSDGRGRSAASRALRSVGMRGKQSPLAFLSFPRNQPEWLDESVSAFTEIYLWG